MPSKNKDKAERESGGSPAQHQGGIDMNENTNEM